MFELTECFPSYTCVTKGYLKTMAHLLKQNIENLDGSSVKRTKGTLPFEGIKKLKTLTKPLSDVKNIIEDKINIEQVQKQAKSKLISVKTEETFDDELFFYSPYEDLYGDIIPTSLQLEENDISKLVAVFDYFPVKRCQEELVSLPELGVEMTITDYTKEDLCDFIKGIDSTSLLFDD